MSGLIRKAVAKATGESAKTPAENVEEVRLALASLADRSRPPDKSVLEAANKYLARVKALLQGSPETPVVPDVATEGVRAVLSDASTLVHLVETLPLLDFEARKDAVHIFHTAVRFAEGGSFPAVAILTARPQLVDRIVNGYTQQEVALNFGAMLRDCVHYAELSRMVLYSPSFYNFFGWVEAKEFEVASDAFATFKECLLLHRAVVAEFLEAQFEPFFAQYQALLDSTNYVTRRLSLKLLGELLLRPDNKPVMLRYVNDVENLKSIMNGLKDSSKSIQFEAFHVFKVFVFHVDKSQAVVDVLRQNRTKLLKYLQGFQLERAEEKGFQEEKSIVQGVLEKLTPA